MKNTIANYDRTSLEKQLEKELYEHQCQNITLKNLKDFPIIDNDLSKENRIEAANKFLQMTNNLTETYEEIKNETFKQKENEDLDCTDGVFADALKLVIDKVKIKVEEFDFDKFTPDEEEIYDLLEKYVDNEGKDQVNLKGKSKTYQLLYNFKKVVKWCIDHKEILSKFVKYMIFLIVNTI